MLSLLLLSSVVGGFAYKIDTHVRSKRVTEAPEGEKPIYTETVSIVVPAAAADRPLNTFLHDAAETMLRHVSDGQSFEQNTYAAWTEIYEDVIAASPDVVSLYITANCYAAGMAHANLMDNDSIFWSRRLNRPLRQDEIFARPPDRALRRWALRHYDNINEIAPADFPDGLPLSWNSAAVGPEGITWSFGPYQLGSYLSGGAVTIPWSVLKPYLIPSLPFTIADLKEAPPARSGDD